jgi:type II secretory pathway pseudopilin PulG
MSAGPDRVRAAARRLACDERGFALPTTLLLVFAVFAVASVAVFGSLVAQSGTSRDFQTKDALAAAEAGVNDALLRYNGTTIAAGTWGVCLPSGLLQTSGTNAWCPAQSGSLPDGSTYSWQVGFPQQQPGAPAPPHTLSIVAKGTTGGVTTGGVTTGGVTRRVDVQASSAASQQPFLNAGIIGLNSVGLDSNARLTGTTATNGDVTLANTNDYLCGPVQVGPGRNILPQPNSQPTCPSGTHSPLTQGVTTAPTVNEGDIATNNNNANFFSVNPVVSGQTRRACFGGRNADGTTGTCGPRELVLTNGGGGTWVTLNGGNYSLCTLILQQGTGLYIASGAKVTIYFDAPENCPGQTNGVTQMSLDANSGIQANGGTAPNVRLLFVGSDALSTKVVMSSNTTAQLTCNQDFVIYGPRTDIEMRSNSYFCGAVAGKTIHVDSNTQILTSNVAQQYTLPNWVDHYELNGYKECGPVPSGATTPDAGC